MKTGIWWWDALISMFNPGGSSLSMNTEIEETGYNTEAERMSNRDRLKTACDFAVAAPMWEPSNGITHCNEAVAYIAEEMGCRDLRHLLANDQIEAMAGSPDWQEDLMERAVLHASRGGLAVATMAEEPHGHVCVVYPAPMQPSGSWGVPVAVVANVGRKNAIMRLSEAFKAADADRVRFFLHGEV